MTTYTVNAGEGSTTGNNSSTTNTLNGAIYAADTGAVGNYIINITAGFTFNTDLLAINLPSGSTLTIEGTNGSGGAGVQTLNGGGSQRGLFVYSGTVNVNNLTLTGMAAVGGTGAPGGGGGAGLGGGLFVASTGVVTLDNVTFLNDTAQGGNGGAGSSSGNLFPAIGGGGGLGGAGGAGGPGGGSAGGGGGVGRLAAGGSIGINGSAGHGGIIPGASGGGRGGTSGGAGGASPTSSLCGRFFEGVAAQ
jgi:hypothetical protein